jgi:hypothetical protein
VTTSGGQNNTTNKTYTNDAANWLLSDDAGAMVVVEMRWPY